MTLLLIIFIIALALLAFELGFFVGMEIEDRDNPYRKIVEKYLIKHQKK